MTIPEDRYVPQKPSYFLLGQGGTSYSLHKAFLDQEWMLGKACHLTNMAEREKRIPLPGIEPGPAG